MKGARENILQRIRQANRQAPQNNATEIVGERLKHHERGPIPAGQQDLVSRFIKNSELAAARLSHMGTNPDVVEFVMTYLFENGIEEKLVCSATPLLNQLQWPDALRVETRVATMHDTVVLVEAKWAIAETGSIVMCSSEDTPVSLNFLPDHYICVVHRHSIVSSMEDVWDRLRTEGRKFPRAINIITGPSRTADVEQNIQMGAHGPRCVHILLME